MNSTAVHRTVPLQGTPPALHFGGGKTAFKPAVEVAHKLMHQHGPIQGFTTVVVFMSDGGAGDAAQAARLLQSMAQAHLNQFACYTVGFGSSASRTLESMAFANGVQEKTNYRTADVGSLGEAFAAVAASISPGRI